MSSLNLPEIISNLQQQAQRSQQRRLLVCSGSAQWCRQQVGQIIPHLNADRIVYIGDYPEGSIPVLPAKQSRQWLGRELDTLIFDAHCGFDVDAFGAISGTVCAGGLMILLVPELSRWHTFVDPEHQRIQVYPQTAEQVSGHYLRRLSRLIEESDLLTLMTEQGVLRHHRINVEINHAQPSIPKPCRTKEQIEAVAAVHKVVRGHRRRPLVLTADRGRGKSAALGIAAGQLLNEGLKKILVTAPASQATEVLFRHAASIAEPESLQQSLQFIAPDDLLTSLPDADLLLVDEAAAIPAPLLEQMLSHYSRVVFASTIHGYEGTGRGFAIRFRQTLDARTPQWRNLHINEPIRWAQDDPLEAFVFKALLLNAAPANLDKELVVPVELIPVEFIPVEQYQFRRITSDDLLKDESLLNELFGLLVLAHYQTRPFDLRHLLDGGNIEIFALFHQQHLIATVLAAREGDIEEALVEPVWLGQRRVRGHLLPQSLSNHLGIADAIRQTGLRIIRIAVHPQLQQQGLGRRLLQEVRQEAINAGYDYLGTAFGATPELLSFWYACGLKPVRVGMTRDAASGTHSVLMLQGLSQMGESLQTEALFCFRDQFHWLLADGLQGMDGVLVTQLLRQGGIASIYRLTAKDRLNLHSYCSGLRQYDGCISVIRHFSFLLLSQHRLAEDKQRLLVARVLQNKTWQQVASLMSLPGQKQVQALLRKTIATLYTAMYPK